MINKLLLSTAALVALAGTAFAADLPSRRAPPVYAPAPPIPLFSWTGVYIGGQLGYEFGKDTATNFATGAVNGAVPKGVIGGAHIGYNFSTQSLPLFGNAFGSVLGAGGVIGIEGDVDGTNYRQQYAFGALGISDKQTVQGSIRGRLGVAVDRILFYATGGAAFGGLTDTYQLGAFNTSINKTRVGYTVGGGIEYAFTNNWSVRAEYRYTDFGTYTDVPFVAPFGVSHRATDNRVQAGFSYKFDTFVPAPVVARY